MSPFIFPNHGFYSLNTTVFFDIEKSGLFKLKFYELIGLRSYR